MADKGTKAEMAGGEHADQKNVQDLTLFFTPTNNHVDKVKKVYTTDPLWVQNLLQQMQDKFSTMSDQILVRIDEMGKRVDELEKNIGDLMKQAELDEPEK